MSLQLFVWIGQGQNKGNRTQYSSFSLNDTTYSVGDYVYLYPEDEAYPPYIARILAAFVDKDVQATGADPHCIEVKWFERRTNLEPSTKGIEESEREVFELEDCDVNPIGCISGKCHIVKASNYEEALARCGPAGNWYFCRGYFQQSSNSFVAYKHEEMATDLVPAVAEEKKKDSLPGPSSRAPMQPPPPEPSQRSVGQRAASAAASAAWANGGVDGEDDEDSDVPPPNQRRPGHHNPPAQQGPASKRQKSTGRTCVECGATSTPQWREGPMGPKTLCNACGVRYVRSQQKAAGQKRSSGGQKNGQGRAQGSRAGRRGSPKTSQSEPQTSDAGLEPAYR